MTTPAPPQIGFGGLVGRTWAVGDIHTAARWRADMTDLGWLFAGKCRPMLLSYNNQAQALSNGTAVQMNIGPNVPLNTWNVPVQNQNVPPTVSAFQVPFQGVYLIQGDLTITTAGTPANFRYAMGFQYVQNGGASTPTDAGSSPATSSTSTLTGMAGCELIWFNTFAATADTIQMYAFTNNSSPGHSATAALMIEWVGLPLDGTNVTGYLGAYGLVVPSPQPAAAPPSGQGTTLVNTVFGGQSVIQVADPAGIVPGMTIGVGYINGTPVSSLNPGNPGGIAADFETVTVTAVNGVNISVGLGCFFNHAAGDPVSVPMSAAFMNQQVRDVVNFLYYPPMARAAASTTQSIPNQVFPSGTQITNLVANIDNFSGFASNTYTAPVAGVYLVYGQVYLAGSTSSFTASAGIQVNGGTVNWGTRLASTSTSAQHVAPPVRRHLRLNAGDTVTLSGFQDSGSSMSTVAGNNQFSKLIVLWRSF